jgi:hypothetical protein
MKSAQLNRVAIELLDGKSRERSPQAVIIAECKHSEPGPSCNRVDLFRFDYFTDRFSSADSTQTIQLSSSLPSRLWVILRFRMLYVSKDFNQILHVMRYKLF